MNKDNCELYLSILRMYETQVESEFWKRVLYNYIDMPKYKRELIVFQDIVNQIEYSIKKNIVIAQA